LWVLVIENLPNHKEKGEVPLPDAKEPAL